MPNCEHSYFISRIFLNGIDGISAAVISFHKPSNKIVISFEKFSFSSNNGNWNTKEIWWIYFGIAHIETSGFGTKVENIPFFEFVEFKYIYSDLIVIYQLNVFAMHNCRLLGQKWSDKRRKWIMWSSNGNEMHVEVEFVENLFTITNSGNW